MTCVCFQRVDGVSVSDSRSDTSPKAENRSDDEDKENEPEEEEEEEDDEDEDGGGWITPSNIKQVKMDSADWTAPADVRVGCLTTDFAMQVLGAVSWLLEQQWLCVIGWKVKFWVHVWEAD